MPYDCKQDDLRFWALEKIEHLEPMRPFSANELGDEPTLLCSKGIERHEANIASCQ
jgi:hypothetical protein